MHNLHKSVDKKTTVFFANATIITESKLLASKKVKRQLLYNIMLRRQ
jgi:hypothetical protein